MPFLTNLLQEQLAKLKIRPVDKDKMDVDEHEDKDKDENEDESERVIKQILAEQELEEKLR